MTFITISVNTVALTHRIRDKCLQFKRYNQTKKSIRKWITLLSLIKLTSISKLF